MKIAASDCFTFSYLNKEDNGPSSNIEAELAIMAEELSEEKKKLVAQHLNNDAFLKKLKSSPEFWNNEGRMLPRLRELALVLSNINSSSAFIERFFSIAEIVNKKRSARMSDQLLVMRSMLKANMSILKEHC